MVSSVLPLASSVFQSVIVFSMPTVIEPPFLAVPVFWLFSPTVEVLTLLLLPPLLLLEHAVAVSASALTAATPAKRRRFLDSDMESLNPLARAHRPARDRFAACPIPRCDRRSAG